jgi:hypothetical protein
VKQASLEEEGLEKEILAAEAGSVVGLRIGFSYFSTVRQVSYHFVVTLSSQVMTHVFISKVFCFLIERDHALTILGFPCQSTRLSICSNR